MNYVAQSNEVHTSSNWCCPELLPPWCCAKWESQCCWQMSDEQYTHASFHTFYYDERFTECNVQVIRKYAVFFIVSAIQLIDSPRVTSLIHAELIFFTNLWLQLTNEYR